MVATLTCAALAVIASASSATAVNGLPAWPEDPDWESLVPGPSNRAFKVDAGLTRFVQFQKAGKTYPFPDQLWPNPKVQQAHLVGLQNIFAGRGTVLEMLRAMDRAYRSK